VQLLCGTGWGQQSPVDITSPLVFAICHLRDGQSIALPDHAERCAYPVAGAIAVDGHAAQSNEMLVFSQSAQRLQAIGDAVVVLLGGAPIGERHFWSNLIHSDPARLKEQAERWYRGEFPPIPNDLA